MKERNAWNAGQYDRGIILARGLDSALVHTVDEVYVGPTQDADIWDESRVIEARFFSKDEEWFFFRNPAGNLVSVAHEAGLDESEETQVLATGKHVNPKGFATLQIRHRVEYDEDGQAVVTYSRLVGLK